MVVLDFIVAHKVLIFYGLLALFVFLNRKKFEIHAKIVAMYKSQWGIPLMSRMASRHGELVRLFGYIGIGAGFIGMALMVGVILHSVYTLLTVPNAPAAVAPVLPGVTIPGVEFQIPLITGLIAIFIVAVIHEFAHGVVARAHNIRVKSSGPAIIGPFFAAFVEPDEVQVKKKPDVAQYSLFAAGSFSNMLTAVVVVLLLFTVLMPAMNAFFPPEGIYFPKVLEGSPAEAAGLQEGVMYTMVDGQEVRTTADFIAAIEGMQAGVPISIGTADSAIEVIPGPRPKNAAATYIGVNIATRLKGESTAPYAVASWFVNLFSLIGSLSLAIGLANMLPIGPLDGGRMMQLALHKTRGEAAGNRALVKVSIALLLIILLLMTPIFRATFNSLVPG
jgi:membrane-associated protease RseP (regulator of RpoE activity)